MVQSVTSFEPGSLSYLSRMSNPSPNHLFSDFLCSLLHRSKQNVLQGGRSRLSWSFHTQPFRTARVTSWPGHIQNSCWNPNHQGVDGTRGWGLCVATWVESTWLRPVSLQQRAHGEQWVLTADDKVGPHQRHPDFGFPPYTFLRIYLLFKPLASQYFTTASYLQRELKIEGGQQSARRP